MTCEIKAHTEFEMQKLTDEYFKEKVQKFENGTTDSDNLNVLGQSGMAT